MCGRQRSSQRSIDRSTLVRLMCVNANADCVNILHICCRMLSFGRYDVRRRHDLSMEVCLKLCGIVRFERRIRAFEHWRTCPQIVLSAATTWQQIVDDAARRHRA